MNDLRYISFFVCAVLFFASCRERPVGSGTDGEERRPPNILWITNEDMSPRLGCYGDTAARTPHIDRLAGEGLLFTHAFSISGVCSPSRSALITGCYPTSIGTLHHRTTTAGNPSCAPYLGVPPPEVKAFPEYLRRAGYYCTNNSKTDYQFGVPVTIWDENGSEAHWRNRPDPDQPFFAVFNNTMTHESRLFRRERVQEMMDEAATNGQSTNYLQGVLAPPARPPAGTDPSRPKNYTTWRPTRTRSTTWPAMRPTRKRGSACVASWKPGKRKSSILGECRSRPCATASGRAANSRRRPRPASISTRPAG